MSRAGTPTDNPIIESLNGWIKEELFLDFYYYFVSVKNLQNRQNSSNLGYFDAYL